MAERARKTKFAIIRPRDVVVIDGETQTYPAPSTDQPVNGAKLLTSIKAEANIVYAAFFNDYLILCKSQCVVVGLTDDGGQAFRELARLEVSGTITTASSDDSLLVIGDNNGKAFVAELAVPESGIAVKEIVDARARAISCIATSAVAKSIATASLAGATIDVWGRASHGAWTQVCCLALTAAAEALAFSPDGLRLASGGKDKIVTIWDVSARSTIKTLKAQVWVKSLAFSADGRLVAGGADTVVLWKGTSEWKEEYRKNQKGQVGAVAFSCDGAHVAVSCNDATRLIGSADGSSLVSIPSTCSAASISFRSASELAIVAKSGALAVWCLTSQDCTRSAQDHLQAVASLAYSADGSYFASCSRDQTIRLLPLTPNSRTTILAHHSSEVRCVAFNSTGSELVSSSQNEIRVWNVVKDASKDAFMDVKCLAVLSLPIVQGAVQGGLHSVAFSCDHQIIAAGCDNRALVTWQSTDDGWIQVDKQHTVNRAPLGSSVTTVVSSPKAQHLFAAACDKYVWIGPLPSGRQPSASQLEHDDIVTSVQFNPAGTILVAGAINEVMKLWSVDSYSCVGKICECSVTAVAFSPNGLRLATAGKDMFVRVWRIAERDGKRDGICESTFAGHSARISSVAFSSDGLLLSSGDDKGLVRNWRTGIGALVGKLAHTPTHTPTAVVFSDDESFVATVYCHTANIWSLPTCEYIATLPHHSREIQSVELFGKTVLTTDTEGDRRCWSIVNNVLLVENAPPGRDEAKSTIALNGYQGMPNVPLPPLVQMSDLNLGDHFSTGVVDVDFNGSACVATIPLHPSNAMSKELTAASYLHENHGKNFIAIKGITVESGVARGLILERFGEPLSTCDLEPGFDAYHCLCQVAEALEIAHDHSVHHGSIKPQNIFVQRTDGRVSAKLANFAMSSVRASDDESRNCGSEQTDVLGFGILLYSVLSKWRDIGLNERFERLQTTWNDRNEFDVEEHLAPFSYCWSSDSVISSVCEQLKKTVDELRINSTLWKRLASEQNIVQLRRLPWSRIGKILVSGPIGHDRCCYWFVRNCLGSTFETNGTTISSIEMVGGDATEFMARHANGTMPTNLHLVGEQPPGVAASSALEYFYQKCLPGGEGGARMILAWHGTELRSVIGVCCDGLRPIHRTDCGYFGDGSYLALEADYAKQYRRGETDHALVLFAVSVTQVFPMMLSEDTYHPDGFSKYCARGGVSAALKPCFDAHFIPVKYYGNINPMTSAPGPISFDYQAVSELRLAEAHELVIRDYERCTPLAIVRCRTVLP
jgi:WD40 repeat protein